MCERRRGSCSFIAFIVHMDRVCPAFQHAVRNGYSPPHRKQAVDNRPFWGDQCQDVRAEIPHHASTQGKLFILAGDALSIQSPANRAIPVMWQDAALLPAHEGFVLPGGFLTQRLLHANATRDAFLLIPKNGIITYHRCAMLARFLYAETASRRTMLHAILNGGHSVRLIAPLREPSRRFLSAIAEVVLTYKWLKGEVRVLDSTGQINQRFLHDITRNILRANESRRCNPSEAYSLCYRQRNVTSHFSHASTKGWEHIWPQVHFLNAWTRGTAAHVEAAAINHSFELSDPAAFPHALRHMEPPMKTSNATCPNNDHHHGLSSHLLGNMSAELAGDPALQRSICRLYALDYYCLRYDLPMPCQTDIPLLCRAVSPSRDP